MILGPQKIKHVTLIGLCGFMSASKDASGGSRKRRNDEDRKLNRLNLATEIAAHFPDVQTSVQQPEVSK